ncbi:FecCD family ABC transporter permease [Aestuariibius sp. 2305UL40-4]|uniref:FecCD family ABC transporter permease n=1 Tax=Aestuariibius violaceus TaxID=3234132 RepID=UPI00345EDC59
MAADAAATLPLPKTRDRQTFARWMHLWLLLLLIATSLLSLGYGAADASLFGALAALMNGEAISHIEQVILLDVRLPRLLLGITVGAALAISGVLMQGLFRNPLADPGIVGVSAGASLGAIMAIVLGPLLPAGLLALTGNALIALSAFAGAWIAMLILYRVSTRQGRTSVATMLLAGIALAALTGAASGLLIYLADDQQLRDFTFWSLGSLGGTSWAKVWITAPIVFGAILLAIRLAHGLNCLALGEAAARHLGIRTEQLKSGAVLLTAAATGSAVAVSGGIGFIGIVVPHLLRLGTGPDHRPLLINAALLGATLLVGADIISRTIVAPAELPIGIVTAILGAPVFLWILLRRRGLVDL